MQDIQKFRFNLLRVSKYTAAAVFLFVFSFQYLYSDYPANLCSHTDTEQCIAKQVEFIAHEFDINLALLSYIQHTSPEVAPFDRCHETAHRIGALSYKMLGSTRLAFSVPKYTLAFCFGAYIHGLTTEYVESGADQLDPAVVYQETCAILKNTPILHRMCAHGLGHGFLVRAHFDVPAALAACDSVVLSKACHGGVFMENTMVSLPEWHTHAKDHDHKYYKYGDAFFPCTLLANYKYRSICYATAPIQAYNEEVLLLKKPLAAVTKNIFSSCRKARQYQNDCLRGVGQVLGKLTKWEHTSLQQACNQGATNIERQACADGAFAERTIAVMQPLDLKFCDIFSGFYKARCSQYIQKDLRQSLTMPI